MRETRTDEKTDNLIYKLNAKCKIDKFKLNFPNKKKYLLHLHFWEKPGC